MVALGVDTRRFDPASALASDVAPESKLLPPLPLGVFRG